MASSALKLNLCDSMGYEDGQPLIGPSLRDIELIMDGHVQTDYEVNKFTYKSHHIFSINHQILLKDND